MLDCAGKGKREGQFQGWQETGWVFRALILSRMESENSDILSGRCSYMRTTPAAIIVEYMDLNIRPSADSVFASALVLVVPPNGLLISNFLKRKVNVEM